MIDNTAAQLAFRARAQTVVVCTTGAVALTATGTTYTRSTGSFLTDGFAPGMEITPSGFVSNPVDVVQSVSDLTLTTNGSRSSESATATLTVGFPGQAAYDNVDFNPNAARPFIEESWVPATNKLQSLPANGGTTFETGLYTLNYYGLSNYGVSAGRKMVDSLKKLFSPGTAVALSGVSLTVRSDVGPFSGQFLPHGNGYTCVTLKIPWRAISSTSVLP